MVAWAAASGAIALLLALLGSLYKPGDELPIRQFWLVAAGAAVAAAILFGIVYAEATRRAAVEAVRTAPSRLPRIVYSVVEPWVGDGPRSEQQRVVLILTPTDLLGADDLVSVFNRDELDAGVSYERFIGLGVVQTINQGDQPQVVVFHEARGGDETWRKVRERDAVALKALVVRPGAQFLRLTDWRALNE